MDGSTQMICKMAKECGRASCDHHKPHDKNTWCGSLECAHTHKIVQCIPYKEPTEGDDDYTKALSLASILAPSLRPNKDGLYDTASGSKSLVGVYKLIRDEVTKQ